MVGPLNIGMSREAAEKRAREALSMVGLLDAAEESPYDLDLSERKMVAIASVVILESLCWRFSMIWISWRSILSGSS